MARDLQPADHLIAPAAALVEWAWHLLTVLLRLGRPAPAAELASVGALEPSPSPDLVNLLCRLPGSPLRLTDDGFVTPSDAAMTAFLGFFSYTVAPFVPRAAVHVLAYRACGDVSVMYVRKRKVRPLADDLVVDVPMAKRSLLLPDGGNPEEVGSDNGVLDQLSIIDHNEKSTKEELQIDAMFPGIPSSSIDTMPICSSGQGNLLIIVNKKYPLPVAIDSTADDSPQQFCNKIQATVLDFQNYKHNCCDNENNATPKEIMPKGIMVGEPDVGLTFQDYVKVESAQLENELETMTKRGHQMTDQLPTWIKVDLSDSNNLGVKKYNGGTIINHAFGPVEDAEANAALPCQSERASVGMDPSRKSIEELFLADQADGNLEPSAFCLSANISAVHNQQSKLFMKPTAMETPNLGAGLHSYASPIDHQRDGCSLKKDQENNDFHLMVKKQNMKSICNNNIVIKDNTEDPTARTPKSHLETKSQPSFESFIIEEEEGSGGYGTVYRARRKTDGKVFAVKCPHANAHSHHVDNEMKMLERFGGRNFVIKYEGSFSSGNSECFVLEHVEHDRPEVLKKEINVFELQWYGYCMFKALASLHKQGIVHRDVKPGNFLFSRKLNKGYLIDFNLANDLHQKFLKNGKHETDFNTKLDPVPPSNMNSSSLKYTKRVTKDRIQDNGTKEAVNGSRKNPSKNLRRRSESNPREVLPKIDRNRCGSQAADVSGVTSTKDPTSTRTPIDKLKQPIPCKGRKELINFLHEAMQTPDQKGSMVPASQRKRVAAPLGKVDRRLVMLTPMPLHYGGNAVAGAGLLNSKRNGKHKREGPCVGTKGFRAPEVLFKSIHQGCKVDIWSAGVTLLYLMIGKTTFGGDPEQNIKDIAKLRGSEDLWEVAKLHNCESSFPQELFDVRSLRTTDLREWCLLNTKRPELIEGIPNSLFDLVDKCLTVNPRCRITAEEALMHDFFAPCHESLRRQRKLRREAALESGTSL